MGLERRVLVPASFSLPVCCEDFRAMFEDATDNEGYRSLGYQIEGGVICIGTHLEPIRFCPWCGADVSDQRYQQEKLEWFRAS